MKMLSLQLTASMFFGVLVCHTHALESGSEHRSTYVPLLIAENNETDSLPDTLPVFETASGTNAHEEGDFDETEWQEFEIGDDLEGFEEITSDDGTIDLTAADPMTARDVKLQDTGGFYRLDPYYSSMGYTWALSDNSRVQIVDGGEWEVYQKLLRQSLLPEFLTLEVSVYPMPLAGVAIKKELPDVYDDAEFGDDFNLVETVTAGFDEPYSVSALFSNVSAFRPHDATSDRAPNVGFMGYLLSAGEQHIFQNELIQDFWYELEWKVKGSFESGPESFDWGMQIGVKNHRNDDITDTLYFKFERNNIVRGGSYWSLWENTGFAFSYSVTRSGFKPVEISAFITRFFPIANQAITPALAIGIIRQGGRKYSRDFQDENSEVETYTLAIRPTLAF